MEFVQIAMELFFGFIALLVLTKVLGKTQITQITAFDFISAIVLGELVGNALYDNKIGITQVLFAVIFWGILIFSTEMITQKFKGTREILEGKPSIIIHKGQISYQELKKNHLDINQLQLLLRAKDAFSVREVEFAILETDGTVSVLKKSRYEKPARADSNMAERIVSLPVTLISDGEVLWDNISECGFDEKWLKAELKAYGSGTYEDILYADWKEGEGTFVQTY
jgi:uncharacterized membrane protein YcaP (DUF421 family)